MNAIEKLSNIQGADSASPIGADAARPIGPSTDALLAEVTTWQDLKKPRLENLLSAIRVVDKIARHPRFPEDAPACRAFIRSGWTCVGINSFIWRHPPAFWDMTTDRFQTILSEVRYILRRLDLHADAMGKSNLLTGVWKMLRDSLPTDERRRGLTLFVRYCVLKNIIPETVNNDTLAAFEAWCTSDIIHENVDDLARRVASGWNWAAKNVPGWPQISLHRPNMRDEYVFKFDIFPPSLAADFDAFLAPLDGRISGIKMYTMLTELALTTGKPVRLRSRPLRPRTIEALDYRTRLALTALVNNGVEPASIKTLADIFSPISRVATILEYHQDRLIEKCRVKGQEIDSDNARSTNLSGIAETLRQIAFHHVGLPTGDIDFIKGLAALVRLPQQTEMTAKNAMRVRQLKEPATSIRFIHLPKLWMGRSFNEKLKAHQQATWALYAVALELFQVTSLRRCEIVSLNIDTDLIRQRPGGLVTHVVVAAENVKGGRKTAVQPLPKESAELLEKYLRQSRPVIAPADNCFLFPAESGPGHRSDSDFGTRLRQRVEKELGAEFNVHLPRHLTVDRLLELFPGNYGLPSKAMRHKADSTTRNHYAGLEAETAARIAADSVIEQRRKFKSINKSRASPSKSNASDNRRRMGTTKNAQ